MIAVVLALVAGAGVYLLLPYNRARANSSLSALQRARLQEQLVDWSVQAGISPNDRKQVGGLILSLGLAGALAGWIIFGGFIAPLMMGAFSATFPVASYRQRHRKGKAEAAEAWPRMIEEIRLMCGSLGRPIPQALIEVGKRGPAELRPAFKAAEREWLISTDFGRTVAVLKDALADPTADATCETLLVAHTIGGSDVDRRLLALAEDRQMDLQGRKDAKAKQAGVRFARRFVLVVPFGMALAGMSIGNGRAAYGTPQGQIGVAFGLITLAACWWWAGLLIRLPGESRVFRD